MSVPHPLHDDGPLYCYGSQEEIEADRAVTVLFHERHQEAETDEDHHVHILKH